MTIIVRDYEVPNCPVKALAEDFVKRLERQEFKRKELQDISAQFNEMIRENKECEKFLAQLIKDDCVSVSLGRVVVAKNYTGDKHSLIEIKQCIK